MSVKLNHRVFYMTSVGYACRDFKTPEEARAFLVSTKHIPCTKPFTQEEKNDYPNQK